MATRFSNGQLSDPGNPQTREGEASAAEPTVKVQQQGPMRVYLNTEDGTTRVEESRPSGAMISPAVEQASARNKAGQPIPLSMAGPNDVLDIPGYGNSLASVYESMGLVVRDGNGYKLVGQESPTAQQPKPQDTKPKAEDQPAGDVRDVPPVSDSSDALLATMQAKAPVGLDAVIESISQNVVPDALYADLGRQLGDEQFAAKAEALHGEFLKSGQAALANVGVTDTLAFQEWVQANRKDAASDAVRDLVVGKSVARLQDLGRAFVAQNNEKLATLIQSKGVDAEVRNGEVFVSRKSLGLPASPKNGDFGGSDAMSLRDAIRAGHISFSN